MPSFFTVKVFVVVATPSAATLPKSSLTVVDPLSSTSISGDDPQAPTLPPLKVQLEELTVVHAPPGRVQFALANTFLISKSLFTCVLSPLTILTFCSFVSSNPCSFKKLNVLFISGFTKCDWAFCPRLNVENGLFDSIPTISSSVSSANFFENCFKSTASFTVSA